MTSTGNSVGMEAREAGRNEPMNTPLEALERLKAALDIADRYADGVYFGEGDAGRLNFADLRSLLTSYEAQGERLREVERRATRLIRECEAEFMMDGMWSGTGQMVAWRTVTALKAALTQPPAMEKTDDA